MKGERSNTPAALRVAVYGEIDLNLVDGSAIWLQSVCETLASIAGTRVTLLLRRSIDPDRRFLLADLEANGGVDVVDPGVSGRLEPSVALDRLEELDRGPGGPFSVVLLRGEAVLEHAATRAAFASRLWPYVMTGRGLGDEAIRSLAERSHRLLCQTDAVADELQAIAPASDGAVVVLPPMIAAAARGPETDSSAGADSLRLVYSGKLAPEYCWLEMVEAFARLRDDRPDAEFHVLGDKIHRPRDDGSFYENAARALRETEGLRWHGAVARSDVSDLLAACDIALSLREASVEGVREISTKVLEYGMAGLPVVLNRAPVYERLLGDAYPLFVSGPEDAVRVLTGPALDPELRLSAAAACRAASEEFTFPKVADRLAPHLRSTDTTRHSPSVRSGAGTRKLLVAGHDLKFVTPVRDVAVAASAAISEDRWSSHSEHDESASRAALEHADTVLCEWCLGNAAWYSRNVRPGQRLTIRFHRMELYTDYPRAVELDAVDSVVFVSRHILEGAVEKFGWDRGRLRVIANIVDCDELARPKRPGADLTLALIGYVPVRKRLDLALDLLEEARRSEPGFRMLVVGHPPSEFGWIFRRDEEVAAFRSAYSRVQASDLLRGAVDFVPFSADLPTLLQDVGWIVSTSDSEGHQVSLAEGAASGAIPVVLDRPGARDQYPDRWVHATAPDAAAAVLDTLAGDLAAERAAAIAHASSWSHDEIRPLWVDALQLPPDGGGSVV